MQKRTLAYVLTLATVTFGALGTAALADRMRHDGPPGPMMGMEGHGPMFDFATLDADKDGKVTAEEMAAQRKARIEGLDANADGKIDAAELTAMQMRDAEARARDRAGRMVAAMDADGDGALSAAELLARPMPGGRMIERMDTDGDGAISQAEYDAAMARMAKWMEDRDGPRGGRGHGPKHGNDD